MPKTYSQVERDHIVVSLRENAARALYSFGVKHTSVDYLVEKVKIPKGTFYLFYDSKEALFYDALISFFLKTEEEYLDKLQELDENKIVTSLTEIFTDIIYSFYQKGFYHFLEDENYCLIMRKIPDEVQKKNRIEIRGMLEKILEYFFIEDREDIENFISAFQALFYMLPFGEKIPDIKKALTLLVRGLVLQLVGE